MGATVSLVDKAGVYVDGGKGTSAAPSIQRSQGAPAIAVNQITVAATSTLIVAARTNRNTVTVVNSGATDVFIGPTGVTITTGVLLPGTKGASLTLHATSALYGIAATGTQVVSFLETY